MKRVLIAILCFILVGVTGTFAATGSVSPITDAAVISIAVDENGMANRIWSTDKGWVTTDADSFIGPDGRLLVPMRWVYELIGGSATWTSRANGTTDSVILTAPPIKTETVTVTVTVPEYITQTVTVQVPALLPTLKLVKSSTYLTIVPTATVSFWGLAPIGNDVVSVIAAGYYPFPVGVQTMNLPTDINGYFSGSFTFPADTAIGPWRINAIQQAWSSLEQCFTVVGP